MTGGTSTIAAIASPPGAGARGIVRLSGPRAAAIVRALWVGEPPALGARALCAGRVHDGRGEQPAVCLWMPGPRSFTREDVAELHLPGAPPLLAAAYARVLALGAEPAPPGEFTRRAFLSGRIDLLGAEGVLSLIAARDEAERRSATALLCGGLSQRIERLRAALEDARALVEASLDFDEGDTGGVAAAEIDARAGAAAELLTSALAWERQRGAALGLPRVALFGAANAGKSALFNALTSARRRARGQPGALVSDIPGTTRDALAAPWTLAFGEALLVDAAGLEPPAARTDAASLTAEAQARARVERETADLVLWVVDASRARDLERLLRERALLGSQPFLLVWSQVDRAGAPGEPDAPARLDVPRDHVLACSAVTGQGLPELARAVAGRLGLGPRAERGDTGEAPDARGEGGARGEGASGGARELSLRHRRALEQALDELERARAARAAGLPLDLFAAGLTAATEELDAITGRTTPEAILARIFASFCIGK